MAHAAQHAAQQLYTVAVDDTIAQAAAAVTTVAANGSETSSSSGGTFGFLADGFEAFLKVGAQTGNSGCSRDILPGKHGECGAERLLQAWR